MPSRIVVALLIICTAIAGCGSGNGEPKSTGMTGTVTVDGSSTVFPITEAVAEEFQKVQTGVRVTVGISGTGGGFKKFTSGETDISDASRPIKPEEVARAAQHGIEYVELPVAFDGLSVIVNPDNTFVNSLTVAELKRIWEPGSTVKLWSDVRPEWPKRKIRLYGPGTDSGTFDYFTEAINGKSQSCRADFTASEDDNVLVQGIAGDPDALGFFGFAYYIENQDKLKLVPIDDGNGPIAPSEETINNGTYAPLSRPIFIYVGTKAAQRPEVGAFVDFYLEHAPVLVGEVGYISLPQAAYALAKDRFARRVTGSVFEGRSTTRIKLEDLLSAESAGT
ncbi:MAG TPA: PstS family phosphate ABC transporter substrate-binding protein [candidate division Zixibacteria bacterium]|jgi:phosphate transport system substrate-binding protein